MSTAPSESPVEVVRRWETFGGVWEVVHRSPQQLVIALLRCDGGEEVSRVISDDPELRAFVDGA